MTLNTPDIIIPTCKTMDDWKFLEMVGTLNFINRNNKLIFTCLPGSAAKNRNHGLNSSDSDIVIMCDDDIRNFYVGWEYALTWPLREFSDIMYVSARLMNPDLTPQIVMGGSVNLVNPIVDVPTAPSACVAFRKTDIRFDENFIGSGWEDTDFVRQLKVRYPHGRIVINNMVKIVHLNEMKNQLGENYQKNREYYNKKWGCNET